MQGSNSRKIPLKYGEDVPDNFVFRRIIKPGKATDRYWAVSENLALRYEPFYKLFNKLTRITGYIDRITLYALRRTAANALNTPDVTAADRSNLIGHNAQSKASQAYQSKRTQYDMSSMIFANASRSHLLQLANKLERYPQLALQVSRGARLAILQDPAVLDLKAQQDQVKLDIYELYDTVHAAREAEHSLWKDYERLGN